MNAGEKASAGGRPARGPCGCGGPGGSGSAAAHRGEGAGREAKWGNSKARDAAGVGASPYFRLHRSKKAAALVLLSRGASNRGGGSAGGARTHTHTRTHSNARAAGTHWQRERERERRTHTHTHTKRYTRDKDERGKCSRLRACPSQHRCLAAVRGSAAGCAARRIRAARWRCRAQRRAGSRVRRGRRAGGGGEGERVAGSSPQHDCDCRTTRPLSPFRLFLSNLCGVARRSPSRTRPLLWCVHGCAVYGAAAAAATVVHALQVWHNPALGGSSLLASLPLSLSLSGRQARSMGGRSGIPAWPIAQRASASRGSRRLRGCMDGGARWRWRRRSIPDRAAASPFPRYWLRRGLFSPSRPRRRAQQPRCGRSGGRRGRKAQRGGAAARRRRNASSREDLRDGWSVTRCSGPLAHCERARRPRQLAGAPGAARRTAASTPRPTAVCRERERERGQ